MNYEKQCWRLLVIGLVFSFILGGLIAGVVYLYQSSSTIKSNKTMTVDGKKI